MIDLVLRGGAIALLVLWAALMWRGPRGQRLFAGASLCGAIYVALKSAPIAATLGWAQAPLQGLAATGPFWFLIGVRRAFGAKSALTAAQLAAGGAVLAALGFAAAAMPASSAGTLSVALDCIVLALFLLALFAAWRGLADDLEPGRRQLRLTLIGTSAAFGVLVTLAALAKGHGMAPAGLRASVDTLVAAGIFLSALALSLVTLRPRDTEIRLRPASQQRSPLAETIIAVMERDKLYRQPDLTLGLFAAALGKPEHQVRAAINTELGFKSFSEFINGHRLIEVKEALTDAAQTETPISTIALDAGFGSITSFNRVFKAAFGVAPSAYRRSGGA